MGTSPEQYLTQVRLERARDLLETEFMTIKEIRHAVGINDANHFNRSFKDMYGLTPTKCRYGNKHRAVKETMKV